MFIIVSPLLLRTQFFTILPFRWYFSIKAHIVFLGSDRKWRKPWKPLPPSEGLTQSRRLHENVMDYFWETGAGDRRGTTTLTGSEVIHAADEHTTVSDTRRKWHRCSRGFALSGAFDLISLIPQSTNFFFFFLTACLYVHERATCLLDLLGARRWPPGGGTCASLRGFHLWDGVSNRESQSEKRGTASEFPRWTRSLRDVSNRMIKCCLLDSERFPFVIVWS